MVGADGDDVLIDDYLRGSSIATQQTAARNVLERWSTNESYANRVASLKTDLVSIIFNDATDSLAGGGGLEWFLADRSGPFGDIILDRLFGEMVTDTRT